jgi:hypothetical protein
MIELQLCCRYAFKIYLTRLTISPSIWEPSQDIEYVVGRIDLDVHSSSALDDLAYADVHDLVCLSLTRIPD